MKLNIIGSWFDSSGYSAHTKGLTNALSKYADLEIALTCNKTQDWIRYVSDTEMQMMNRKAEDCDTILFIGMPTYWHYYLNEGKKFIGFVVWEGDKVPKYWLETLMDDRVNQIWAPSKHVYDAIKNTIGDTTNIDLIHIMDKVRIVTHGVDLSIFKPIKKEPNEVFTFFSDKGYRDNLDRGGLQFSIKAYLESFTSKDNVNYLIKINPAYGVSDLGKLISKLNVKNKDLPKMTFCIDNVTFDKLNELYNKADVFVNPTMAEGFHLGGLQSMACGVPVIANDFGGQMEYMEDDYNGWLLRVGKMIDVEWDLMYEGVKWKTVDVDELGLKMHQLYLKWIEDENWIKNTFEDRCIETAKRFTWEESGKKAYSFLKEIL